jgi:threonine dehydrogenase-like Zn-dependent dehydrogenase
MSDWELVADGGTVRFRTLPDEDLLPPGRFDVRTRYSGVSAGTELSFLNGTNPMLRKHWNPRLRLFGPGPGRPPTLGYMEVGEVIATRTNVVPVGATVAMTYGHRSRYRADPGADRFVVVPVTLDPLLGVFVAHMGPTCANGLLHAAAEHTAEIGSLADGVHGCRVAITGCGVVALLTALFARAHGADTVVLIDSSPDRRALAGNLGFEAIDPGDDPAVVLKSRWRSGPGDRGPDVVFQCRGTASSLAMALRLIRPRRAVIDLAFYQGGAPQVRLGEEFHHNGLVLRCAQIGHLPPRAGPMWTRDRLSAETISLLRQEGPAISRHLITDVVPAEQAPRLFDDLVHRRRHIGQAVLRMNPGLPGGPRG